MAACQHLDNTKVGDPANFAFMPWNNATNRFALVGEKDKNGNVLLARAPTGYDYGIIGSTCKASCNGISAGGGTGNKFNQACAKYCPPGYKWMYNASGWAVAGSNAITDASGQKKACYFGTGVPVCKKEWDSSINEDVRFKCCTGKYTGEADKKANCDPHHCPQSAECDQFMTTYCGRADNKSKVECACFAPPAEIPTSLPTGPIKLAPHCFSSGNDCAKPEAYRTTVMRGSQCPSLAICDVTGNTLNVTGSVKITQKCDLVKDPKTGQYVPPDQVSAPSVTKPADDTTPTPAPALAAAPAEKWYQRGFMVGQTKVPYVPAGGVSAGLVLLLIVGLTAGRGPNANGVRVGFADQQLQPMMMPPPVPPY